MRYIRKKEEPSSFVSWRSKYPSSGFGDISGDTKRELKKSLTDEQQGLCCYCESRLDADNSHIEHLKPKSKYKESELDYGNMLCSCQSQMKQGEPKCCGMAKGDWYEERLLISPFDPDCGKHFSYRGDGSIFPVSEEDEAAKETIKRLALNIPKLQDSRKQVLDVFLDESLTKDEYSALIEKTKEQISRGNPPEYVSALQQILNF